MRCNLLCTSSMALLEFWQQQSRWGLWCFVNTSSALSCCLYPSWHWAWPCKGCSTPAGLREMWHAWVEPTSGGAVGGEPRWTLLPVRCMMLPPNPWHPAEMCSWWHQFLGGKVERRLPPRDVIQHGVPVQASTWGSPAGGMLSCLFSLLGRGAPGWGDTHVPLQAFFGQVLLKFKCINHWDENPGMKFERAPAALDVWSYSKAAAVKPGLEQEETVQWKQGSSNPNLPFFGRM